LCREVPLGDPTAQRFILSCLHFRKTQSNGMKELLSLPRNDAENGVHLQFIVSPVNAQNKQLPERLTNLRERIHASYRCGCVAVHVDDLFISYPF
jgi:hypothetical protein